MRIEKWHILQPMEKLPNLASLSDGQKDQLILLLWEQNQLLRQQVQQLELRIKELENSLAKNSHNSSKPPSSDGYNKPNPKSRREKGKRKSGGQKGHPGTTLKRAMKPDIIVDHVALNCGQCGSGLQQTKAINFVARQVFDIPELKLSVTEHRSYKKCCTHCNCITAGKFPTEAPQIVQYGPHIKSLMVYMNQYQLLPYARLKEFFSDLFNQSISEGTLANINQEMYSKLEKTEEKIKGLLINSSALHVDETGIRIDKTGHWLHVASTEKLTYYGAHRKRGNEAIQQMGILPKFAGTLIHDHMKLYFNYGHDHGLCNAHHLRELEFIHERYKCKWAKDMELFLLNTKTRVEEHYQQTSKRLSEKEIHHLYSRYKNIISQGRVECPRSKKLPIKGARAKQSLARCLLNRLREYSKATLAFMFHPHIPFSNNQAERDIRMTKVRLKISGCFRSETGANVFCRVRGFISTMKKNSANVLASLHSIFINKKISLPMPV